MLSVHPYQSDGTAYCGRDGCGLPRKNWRHDTSNSEPIEDWTEPRHQPATLPIPAQRHRVTRTRKPAPRARARRSPRR